MTSLKKNRLGPVLAAIVFSFAVAGPAQRLAQNNAQPSLNDASANGTLAVFRDFSKYPPESRPLHASNWDLLHPWATDTSSLPMVSQQIVRQVDSLRASGLPEEEVLRAVPIPSSLPKYQFEMNKTILAGVQDEDELRARLTVTPAPGSSLPLRIHVSRAEIIGDSDFGSPNLGSVPFSCEANAPVCTFQWKAPSTQKQYWGALLLEVTVTFEDAADEFVVRQPF